jgi:epoxyqueuosine reductase
VSKAPTDYRPLIRARALALGFDACGFTAVDAAWPAAARLAEFVAEGRHGELEWMETTLERRAHPQAMWPEARSAIVLAINYGPDTDPMAVLAHRDRAGISVYAQGEDYHQLLKGRLKTLADFIKSRAGGRNKVFVDTAPLMEKPLAEAAGLGWQGKHTNLVSRQFGSWLFLGAILTTAEFARDIEPAGDCGTCRACLDVCPTDAFPAPYQLDARKCLSYLTIEFAGPWPEAYRTAMGNRVYGCDDCLAICPWNKFAQVAREQRLQAAEALRQPSLADLAALDDEGFRLLFRRSAVRRIGRERFLRNVLYAIGNSGDLALAEAARPHLSSHDPVVADAAAWAIANLSTPPPIFGGAGNAHLSKDAPPSRG